MSCAPIQIGLLPTNGQVYEDAVQLTEQARERLFESVGIPVELYQGSLQLQTAPAALRLFENNWQSLISTSWVRQHAHLPEGIRRQTLFAMLYVLHRSNRFVVPYVIPYRVLRPEQVGRWEVIEGGDAD